MTSQQRPDVSIPPLRNTKPSEQLRQNLEQNPPDKGLDVEDIVESLHYPPSKTVNPTDPLADLAYGQLRRYVFQNDAVDIITKIPPLYLYLSGQRYLLLLKLYGCYVMRQDIFSDPVEKGLVTMRFAIGSRRELAGESISFSGKGVFGPLLPDILGGGSEWIEAMKGPEDISIDATTEKHFIEIVWPLYDTQGFALPQKVYSRVDLAKAAASCLQKFIDEIAPAKAAADDIFHLNAQAVKNFDSSKLRILFLTRYPGNRWVPHFGFDVDLDAKSRATIRR
ncbi:hypothetical protein BDN70DRAFT_991994 [Pholiota conissans]|uniref:Uncharacterized protein n=1 Tax=Pholiota conissans TaxID=109636 RepID=A0A9P6CW01_9AGAR|nr:hypothetical protein BDN70DRAFT_991994 [Pholiota conissans]